MKIQADFRDEPIIKLDTIELIVEKPLYIEAYSSEEYESNRNGRFIVQIENYQFEKIIEKSNNTKRYRSEGFGEMSVISFETQA